MSIPVPLAVPSGSGNGELTWRVGGPQGGGVDLAARVFSHACAAQGLHLFGRREFYSNIMGRHSYFDLRVAARPVGCHLGSVQVLVCFDPETLARHARLVAPGGVILHHQGQAEAPLASLEFLEAPLVDHLRMPLREGGLPETTGGLLRQARAGGVATLAVPFPSLLAALGADFGLAHAQAARCINILAVAASYALIEGSEAALQTAVERVFAKHPEVLALNRAAAQRGHAWGREQRSVAGCTQRLPAGGAPPGRLLATGTQAVALGKLAGGLGLQTYYPISPSTDESVYLEAHAQLVDRDGEPGALVVVQTEDELAAIAMASGAALTGTRAATATSGPGFSLMAEGLGWAGTNEVPVVVTLYQRGGPSTGMPTRTEQGDLEFALHAGHGEFPRLVLASGDVNEAFRDAALAFNYAERYQLPVVHLLDKALATTTQTLAPFSLAGLRIERGELADPDAAAGPVPFARFEPTARGISPRTVLGQAGGRHWLTGTEHDRFGRVTEDAELREQMLEKRARKLDTAAREIPCEDKLRVYGAPLATPTVVSWGSTKGALLEALGRLADTGYALRLVQLRLLHPFPAAELQALLDGAQPLVVVECNFSGQLARLLRAHTGRAANHLVLKYNGRPFCADELVDALGAVVGGGAPERLVLRNPLES